MSRKIDLVTRKSAWVSEFSALHEPILTVQGYPISLFSIGYLLLSLYFVTKGVKAPGKPIAYGITPIGIIYFTISAIFIYFAFVPKNGVVREVQFIRGLVVVLTNPMSVIPDNTNKKPDDKKKKKKPKKKKPKKSPKKPKKEIELVKLKGGDEQ